MNNEELFEKKIQLRFPYTGKENSSAETKVFFTKPSLITEVSFPSRQIPTLRIGTEDYELRIGRISPKQKDAYLSLGKLLAEIFGQLPEKEVVEMQSQMLTLSKTKIATVSESSDVVGYRCMCPGWIKLWNQTEFVDFLGL